MGNKSIQPEYVRNFQIVDEFHKIHEPNKSSNIPPTLLEIQNDLKQKRKKYFLNNSCTFTPIIEITIYETLFSVLTKPAKYYFRGNNTIGRGTIPPNSIPPNSITPTITPTIGNILLIKEIDNTVSYYRYTNYIESKYGLIRALYSDPISEYYLYPKEMILSNPTECTLFYREKLNYDDLCNIDEWLFCGDKTYHYRRAWAGEQRTLKIKDEIKYLTNGKKVNVNSELVFLVLSTLNSESTIPYVWKELMYYSKKLFIHVLDQGLRKIEELREPRLIGIVYGFCGIKKIEV